MMEGQPIMTCVEIPRETAIDNYGGNDDYYDNGEDPGTEETVGRWNGKISSQDHAARCPKHPPREHAAQRPNHAPR